MDRPIAERDRVRIVALTGSPAEHLIVVTAARAPRVGDIGTVVDIAGRLGGSGRHYTVAHSDPDASQEWLAVFAAHELELA